MEMNRNIAQYFRRLSQQSFGNLCTMKDKVSSRTIPDPETCQFRHERWGHPARGLARSQNFIEHWLWRGNHADAQTRCNNLS